MEKGRGPGGLEAVVVRARIGAETRAEEPPGRRSSPAALIPEELAEFVDRILTDGTYAREVDLIGQEDPDLESI